MSTYRFDEFELDLDAGQLRLRGETVRLERRPFNLLALLVTNPGRLHTREEIIAALWPEKVIIDFDAGLNTLVRKVRHALGDAPEAPRYIETVPARGYRFAAPVTVAGTPAVPAPAAVPDVPVTATPAGAPETPPGSSASTARSRWSYLAAAVLLLAIVATWYALRVDEPPGPAHTRIAVLPFENLSGDAELGYLATGLAQETSTSLGQIDLPNLAVLGIVSSRAISTSELPLQQVARDVGVDFIVDSSLRLDGTRIRVTSHLIRAKDGEQIWSASFNRELTNVLGLQRELSVAITEQVRQRLSPEVAAAIDRRQTQNPEAYRLYLKGREQWTRFQPTLVEDALSWYEQAVALDPEYGLAWAGIAHAATTATITSNASPVVAIPLAHHALKEAQRYGADLAETWVAQAAFLLFIEWKPEPAEHAARRALELDPNSAMAQMTFAMSLAAQGRPAEARAAMRRARELDPLFPLIFANSAHIEHGAGNTAASIELAIQAIAMDPEFWVGYFSLGVTLLETGDLTGALRAFEAADRYSGGNFYMTANRVHALVCLGRDEEASALRDQLVERSVERYVSPYAIAEMEAALGNTDSALEWLNRGTEERNVLLSEVVTPGTRLTTDGPAVSDLLKSCGPVPEGG
jgi:TolB-like protein/DNA-binding winged helix-turn-helix (wHTH) protein/tetratricopeptide (TPR) repeat protein